jgi:DNA-directed RNA polymerase subunit RPC12/RpoP
MPDGWACKELRCAWCGKNLPLTAEHDYQIDEVIEPDCDEGGYTVYACSVCGDTYTDDETDPSGHSYDDDMDAECNDCGYVRKVEYTIVSFVSNSVSKDVRGLAFRFAAQVTGLTMNMEHVADYSAAIATPHSWAVGVRVVRMGAVVSNDTAGTYLANVDKKHTLDIPAVLLMELTETGAEYAVRVRYIPENKEDAPVLARPYMVCEDADGNQMEVYGDEVSATYSDVLSKH